MRWGQPVRARAGKHGTAGWWGVDARTRCKWDAGSVGKPPLRQRWDDRHIGAEALPTCPVAPPDPVENAPLPMCQAVQEAVLSNRSQADLRRSASTVFAEHFGQNGGRFEIDLAVSLNQGG